MKRIINYVFYALTVSFLVFLMTTMNSPSLLVVSHNSVYATPQQEDGSSSGPEITPENEGSEQSEGSNNEENNNVDSSDSSPSDQSNTCPDPDTNDFGNVPTYIGQDGCVYPCPSSEDQSSIPQGCPVESPSQAKSGFFLLMKNGQYSRNNRNSSSRSNHHNKILRPIQTKTHSLAQESTVIPPLPPQVTFRLLKQLQLLPLRNLLILRDSLSLGLV